MDWLPEIDLTSDIPLYRQLYAHFEGLIESGELPVGDRLPATRELAGQLGLNRTTVSTAYEMLEAQGLIAGQVGRGSFVADRSPRRTIDWGSLLPAVPFESHRSYGTAARISFAASRPPDALFPLDEFRRSCEEVLTSESLRSTLQLGPAGGYEPLRQYLFEDARSEGVLGREDDLLITNGCQQALDLLRRVLIRPGLRVAVEDPVYPGLTNVLREGDADLVGLRDLSGLRDLKPQLAVVTPNFQNPTGRSLSLDDRQMILRDSLQNGTVVIENDIYSALRYEGEALPSLKQLAPEAGTVLLRSFSKVAFPGLRLGWVIGPRPLIAAMRHRKQLADLHSNQFSQAVMLRFAESGRLAAHVARMIESGRERLRATLAGLERFFPEGSRWTRPEGGFNLWVTLTGGLDAAALLPRAQGEGVAYLPGAAFAVDHPATGALRLSFGGTEPAQISKGIEILGSICKNEWDARQWAEREPVPAMV